MQSAQIQPDTVTSPSPAQQRTIHIVQVVTIAWMCVELFVSAFAGIRVHSVALTSFAGDSGIELFSAIVVLNRFRVGPSAEKTASAINAMLLYALAIYILAAAILSLFVDHLRPEPSRLGIALLFITAFVMPLLGRTKRRLAEKVHSRALKADAVQSSVCAYMSWIALAGLLANDLLHIAWADSLAALLLLPLVLREASEARKGEICDCH